MVREERSDRADEADLRSLGFDAAPVDRSGPADGVRPADDDEPMDEDEALDREFGLDPHVVAPRTARQVWRNVLLTFGIVVVAAIVVVTTLSLTLQSVQNGIGGLFPQPGAALQRFEDRATALPGVDTAEDLDQRQTEIFTGYDVIALVRADTGMADQDQAALVRSLSAAAGTESGQGVQVLAEAQFGDLRVGVSRDDALSTQRLAVGQQLAAMGGVDAVTVSWQVPEKGSIEDTAAHQRVEVTTTAGDEQLATVTNDVTNAVHAALPDAAVEVTRAGA
ncbi:hypothetical protein [Curtobacterium sp. Leaf261]|uniref:hypothetical protein n=1 Tax=Curtobacterium sp. Leaf261 TaxID=1736311 RepID=UPI0006F89557|nr:hypothetical protein [Curtobacterium sp. Leaf261]KQO64810.1 hypothetical protein ASF23_01030 [Curtobacterium sp. Leaf261]